MKNLKTNWGSFAIAKFQAIQKLAAICTLALIAVIGFSIIACGDGGGGGGGGIIPPPPPPSGPVKTSTAYQSKDSSGNNYILQIIKKGSSRAAAYTPQNGDTYVLTIVMADGEVKRSEGTVNVSDSKLTLTPAGSNATFTVTASGENMSAISGTITFTSGETEIIATVSLTTVPVTVDKTLTLGVNRWETGEAWQKSINLNKFTQLRPKKGDELQFMICGTPDKALEKFSVSFEGYNNDSDWGDYQWLGGVLGDDRINVPGAAFFSHTFSVTFWNEPKGSLINVTISCGDTKTPVDIPQWTVMRTISDFEIYLVGIRNEADERKAAAQAFVNNDNKIPPNLTLTGFNSKYNGMYVISGITTGILADGTETYSGVHHGGLIINDEYGYDEYGYIEGYHAQISGGSVAICVYTWSDDDYFHRRYTGSDKNVKIFLYVFDSNGWDRDQKVLKNYIARYIDDDLITVDYTNGVGTASVAGKIYDMDEGKIY
jgi:hypothetical protein